MQLDGKSKVVLGVIIVVILIGMVIDSTSRLKNIDPDREKKVKAKRLEQQKQFIQKEEPVQQAQQPIQQEQFSPTDYPGGQSDFYVPNELPENRIIQVGKVDDIMNDHYGDNKKQAKEDEDTVKLRIPAINYEKGVNSIKSEFIYDDAYGNKYCLLTKTDKTDESFLALLIKFSSTGKVLWQNELKMTGDTSYQAESLTYINGSFKINIKSSDGKTKFISFTPSGSVVSNPYAPKAASSSTEGKAPAGITVTKTKHEMMIN